MKAWHSRWLPVAIFAGLLCGWAAAAPVMVNVVKTCGGQANRSGFPGNLYADSLGELCAAVVTAPSLPIATCVDLNDSTATDTLVKVTVNKVTITSYLLVAADTVSYTFKGGATAIDGPVRLEGSKGEGVAWTTGPFSTALDSDLILTQSRTVALGGHVCYLLQ